MTAEIPDDILTPESLAEPGAKTALIITADKVEDLEFFYPFYRLTEEGFQVDVATPDGNFKGKMGYKLPKTLKLEDIQSAEGYDLLILPGGKAPAELKKNDRALALIKQYAATGKPIGAICHGPQLLAAANLIDGRVISGYPEIEEELVEAGANYVAEQALVDGQFITGRWPADLPAWMGAVFDVFDTGAIDAAAVRNKSLPHLTV